jgi:elongation factor G
MPHESAKRIRNVALVGHRGSGKTSLNEALLFQAGAINRLGSVADGSTVSDSAPDEKAREMSISASLSSFRWRDRKVNVIDTPGEPSFVADALSALRVCEGAVFVVNAVMGVEVGTRRLWERADEFGLARLVFVNMLDRERADFFRTLDGLKEAFGQHVVATEIPIGSEHEVRGVVDLIDMKAYEYDGAGRDNCREVEIPEDLRAQAEEYREKLMEEVAEVSDELMERYLEGEEIAHEETVQALKAGVTDGRIFPVTCGVATKNLATNRLLDALVEDLPSPGKKGPVRAGEVTLEPREDRDMVAYVFKTLADPFAGRINLFRVYQGVLRHDSQVVNVTMRAKERIGQLIVPQGKEQEHADEFGPGDIGAVAKLKETKAGDVLSSKDERIEIPRPAYPAPVMAFAIEPKAKGDEEKVATALRRLQEEDPTIDFHRDAQTGDQIVAGLSQIHVEVVVERMKERFGVEVTLKPPRVPYLETIRRSAKGHGRHKKQTGGRGQFGDCHIEIEPLPQGSGFEFVDEIKGGVIPNQFIPAVEKGVQEAMRNGIVAGYPMKDIRVRLVDGQYHSVDSSEAAFKVAGSLAFKQAAEQAQPVLLEPIMTVAVTVPEDSVGDVIGDLNSRRGRPLGMEPKGSMTEVRAEVPMAEMLSYAPDLRALRGSSGTSRREGDRGGESRARSRQGVAPPGRSGTGSLASWPVAKELKTVQDDLACAICGRTILKGERPETYLAPGGARQLVCELCMPRAEHAGWIRESAAGDLPVHPRQREPRRSLLARFRRRREGGAAPLEAAGPDADAAPAGYDGEPELPLLDGADQERPPPERLREPARSRRRDVRHVRAIPTNAEVKVERALEIFNESEFPRKIAGIARSLGVPWVSAIPDLATPSEVQIVVAWELSWYRYRVDLGDAEEPVALIAKGLELDEIDAELRDWNGEMDGDGRLSVRVGSEP